MDNKELALKIINEISATPQEAESLMEGVLAQGKALVEKKRSLVDEMLETEDKFYAVIAEIIDARWDTGIFDALDYPVILAVVKGACKPLKLYERVRKFVAGL